MNLLDDSEATATVVGTEGDQEILVLEKAYSAPDKARNDDGIYRSSHGNPANLFVQSYTEGSTALVCTSDLQEWIVFFDQDWTDGLFADRDLTNSGHRISLVETGEGSYRVLLDNPEGSTHRLWSPSSIRGHFGSRIHAFRTDAEVDSVESE